MGRSIAGICRRNKAHRAPQRFPSDENHTKEQGIHPWSSSWPPSCPSFFSSSPSSRSTFSNLAAPTEPAGARRVLIQGAEGRLAEALALRPEYDLTRRDGASYAAIVTVTQDPVGPQHHLALLAQTRIAAIDLAPARINAIIVGSVQSSLALIDYLARAEAVTGQVLTAEP